MTIYSVDVGPVISTCYGPHRTERNSKLGRKGDSVSAWSPSISTDVTAAYFDSLSLGELRHAVMFSNRSTAFTPHIRQVIGFSPQEKVVRPDTGRVVAGVANAKSFRHRPEMQNPRCNVCVDRDTGVAVGSHLAIPEVVAGSRPQPAPFRDDHLLPEPPDEGWRKSLRREEFSPIVGPLDKFHLSGRAPGCSSSAGATI